MTSRWTRVALIGSLLLAILSQYILCCQQESRVIGLGGYVVAAALFVAAVALAALLAWLRSRGKFMFLDGLAHNRGAVVDPWHRFRQLGNSLFGFSFFLMLLQLMTAALIITIVGMIGWHDVQAREFGVHAIVALSVGGVLTLLAVLIFLVLNLLLDDLVVPTMYARNVSADIAPVPKALVIVAVCLLQSERARTLARGALQRLRPGRRPEPEALPSVPARDDRSPAAPGPCGGGAA